MRIGLVYPQTEFGNNPSAILDYAQTAEGLGFSHILAYDHILGANPQRPGGLKGPYSHLHPFQEPMVLFSFMAAATQKLEFTTGIIILPQRQTALFAKQAATLDVLSGGRTRVGIGLGWNEAEYIALGQDFHNRGKRIEEQVTLLRQLWTQSLVTFQGRWHEVPDAGLNPLPKQQPIPIWFGGHANPVLRRIARMGDGWMPSYKSVSDAKEALDLLRKYLEENGREWKGFGLEPRIPYVKGRPEEWLTTMQEWEAIGATHISFNTMGSGLDTPEQHISAVRAIAHSVDLM